MFHMLKQPFSPKSLVNAVLPLCLVLLSGLLGIAPSLLKAESIDPSVNARSFSIQVVKERCIELEMAKVATKGNMAECSVSRFGPLGTVGQRAYYYALYCFAEVQSAGDKECDPYTADGHDFGGVIIFSRDDGAEDLKPIIEHVDPDLSGLAFYQTPEIVSSSAGTFLTIPLRLADTGAEDSGDYYLLEGGHWVTVDAFGWLNDLSTWIARKDVSLNDLVWLDLRTMTAEVSLFRAEDPSCCSSGGTATVKLSIKNRRLSIAAVTETDSESTSLVPSAERQDYREPPAGSSERRAILTAIRPLAERELRQPVRFLVRAMPVADDWVVALLEPVTKDGTSFEWTKAAVASSPQGQSFGGRVLVLALLKREIGQWRVWELALGEISKGLDEWPQRYPNVPRVLFGRVGVATNCDVCD